MPLLPWERKTGWGGIQNPRGQYTRKIWQEEKEQREGKSNGEKPPWKSRIMTKRRQKPVKSSHTTKAVKYGTISLACVSSCHWTAGPQTRAATTDGSRPGRAYRTHTHTTKCSWYNQAALVLITLRENTHTHRHTSKYKRWLLYVSSRPSKLVRMWTHWED